MARIIKIGERTMRVPDEATDEQIQQLFAQPAPVEAAAPSAPNDPRAAYRTALRDEIESEPWYNQALIGAGGAAEGVIMGGKQLLGMDVPESEVASYKDAMSQIRDTPAGLGGEIATYLIPSTGLMKGAAAIPAVNAALGAGGLSTALTGAGLGAVIGGAEGALIPVEKDESRAFNIGANAALGGVVPLGLSGVAAGWNLSKSLLGPLFSKELSNIAAGGIINKAVGDKGDDIVRALDSATPVISPPTAGQAAVSANSPEFSTLQRVAEDFNPTPRLNTEDAAKAARLAQIESVGKTPQILEQAIKDRTAKASANYTAALTGKFKTDPELRRILKDPYIQSVIPDVRMLAKSASNRGAKPTVGQRLQMIEKKLKGRIDGTPLNKPTDDEARALMAVKDELTGWMNKNISGYSKASTEYAKDSKAITEMKIGQNAADILKSNLGGKEKAAALAKAISDETALLRKSGAFMRSGLSDQLDPASMSKLNNVVKELDINTRFEELAKAGSRSNKVKDAIGGVVELPKMLNQGIVIANGLIHRVTGAGKIKSMNSLAEIMQDPALTKKYMELASQKEKNALKFLINAQKVGAIGSTSVLRSQQ